MGLVTRRTDGTEVNPGDSVADFRGDYWTFIRAVVPPIFNRTGKVLVRDGNNHNHQFYQEVFDLTVSDD